jgi:translation initiation factor IF-2
MQDKKHKVPVVVKSDMTLRSLLQKMEVELEEVRDYLEVLSLSTDPSKHLTPLQMETFLQDIKHPYIANDSYYLEYDSALKSKRTPMVTFMGHIDHGKTSLMDYLRHSSLAKKEFGGITQHLGAYTAHYEGTDITILDTPGHQAFTAIRVLSGRISDITILVIALPSGIQEQTRECIRFIKEHNLTCIVAFTKCDLPGLEESKLEGQLLKEGFFLEKFGGNVQSVKVSSKTGEGVSELVERVALTADMLELKSRVDGPAKGYILESQADDLLGVRTTLVVTEGVLNPKDIIVCNGEYGAVKFMRLAHTKASIKFTALAQPVEIVGLPYIEEVGSPFYVMPNLATAKALVDTQILMKLQSKEVNDSQDRVKLGDMGIFQQMVQQTDKPQIILRADTRGSLEGLRKEVQGLGIALDILNEGVGNINISDLKFADDTQAIILAFNVKLKASARGFSKLRLVTGRTVYKLSEELKALLEPKQAETTMVSLGKGSVIQVFTYQGKQIAGCRVKSGQLVVGSLVKITRNEEAILDSKISSIKIGKSSVQAAERNTECGLLIDNYDPILGDEIEGFKEISST